MGSLTANNVYLKFATTIGANDTDGKIVSAEIRILGTGSAKERDSQWHEKWLTAASWEIFIFRHWEEKDKA